MFKSVLLLLLVAYLVKPADLGDSDWSSHSNSEEDYNSDEDLNSEEDSSSDEDDDDSSSNIEEDCSSDEDSSSNSEEHSDSSSSSSSKENHGGKQEKSVVCYFTNWAWYRSGIAKFRPENITASLCTHIIYAFASLDETTLAIVPSDSWADIDNKFFELVTALKDYGLTVLIGIGGWNNSAGNRWSRLLSNSTARTAFVASVITFMKKYNFDGLDMDYEYPGCPQGNRTAGLPTDSENFNCLMSELKTAFGEKYLLTAATAGGKKLIDECYNMKELCQIVDWVNVIAYEYHSSADGETGANAPTCGTNSSWGAVETIKYYINELECPADKIVLGIPFYGQTFTMVETSPAQFGVPVSGPGTAGTYTSNAGTLAYYEICLLIKSGYNYGYSPINDSYAWSGNQFISYDSPTDIIRKSCLINKWFNLKGAMFWTLDYDDFSDACGCGSYPLLTTLNQELRCLNSSRIQCY
uniref:GH18 domain-containing protein n=1 Tax=Homalodisca liturata TaxID=320908 RepID=A0A1B6JBP0_9HEMI